MKVSFISVSQKSFVTPSQCSYILYHYSTKLWLIRLVEFLNPKNSLFHHFAPPASSKARIYLQKSLFPCYFRPMYVCGVNVNFRTYFKKYDGGTWSTRRLFQGSLMYLISELRAFFPLLIRYLIMFYKHRRLEEKTALTKIFLSRISFPIRD